MLLEFDALRRWLPPAEADLHALLEREIAALGDKAPPIDYQHPTMAMMLGELGRGEKAPRFFEVPEDEPSPLLPWLVAYAAHLSGTSKSSRENLRYLFSWLSHLGRRSLSPLVRLTTSGAIPVRAQAYEAIARRLDSAPEAFDGKVLAALVRGISDSSVKVRTTCFELLARQPERAKAALSEAAEKLTDERLALTREALERLGAKATPSGEASAPGPEDARLLGELVGVWAATRSPEVAELVDLLSAGVPSPAAGGRSKTEKESAWLAAARRRDPVAVHALVQVPWPLQWREMAARLEAARGWEDPRIAAWLARLLQELPYKTRPSLELYAQAMADLVALRDVRQREVVQKAAATLLGRHAGREIPAGLKAHAEGGPFEAALSAQPPREPSPEDPVVAYVRKRLAEARTQRAEQIRTEQEFLERIWDDPASDDHRRVFADWLLERGEVRGEFITLQCERAAGRGTRESEARERQILSEHEDRLTGPLAGFVSRSGRVFERGFLAHAVTDTKLLADGLGERAWATVRGLTLTDGDLDAGVLATFFASGGRGVAELHNLWPQLLRRLPEACPDCPLEEISARLWNDGPPLDLRLPRLRRLGAIRHPYEVEHGPNPNWEGLLVPAAWERLAGFTANDTGAHLAGWLELFRRKPWLTLVRILSPETLVVPDPKGWEVRFERKQAGWAPRLVVRSHPDTREVAPLVNGLRALPAPLRASMTIAETRGLDSDFRRALENLRD